MPRQREKDQFGGGGLFIGGQQEELEKELKKTPINLINVDKIFMERSSHQGRISRKQE